jgi:multiple sugar transport system ATP-binding protein
MTHSLTFDRVGKRFDQTVILSDVSFRTEPGEFVVLVGPSGCGKSTLLRLVAGLETISDGEIRAGNRVLNNVAPQDRGVGMVFQSYALYPHMTVRENLAFPLFVKKATADEQARAVKEVAGILGLDPLLDRLPKQLSGGQRQRVAIGRCLVRKPEIYCFDEPLSNLDAALRAQIRVEIKALQRQLKKTTLYVTHDQVEAMTLADRIVVLHRGIVQQVGSPEQLYTQPANRFVARFIGTPSMSLARGKVERGTFRSGSFVVPLHVPDGEVIVGVRVEDVCVCSCASEGGASADDGACFDATIRAVEPVGESGYLHLKVKDLKLEADEAKGTDASSDGDSGQSLLASVPGHAAFGYRVGDNVRIKIRSERCHIFSPTTGESMKQESTETRIKLGKADEASTTSQSKKRERAGGSV